MKGRIFADCSIPRKLINMFYSSNKYAIDVQGKLKAQFPSLCI